MYRYRPITSDGNGKWWVDGESDTEATQPLPEPEPLKRPLQAVFNVDKSEWATNGMFTVYRKEWTPTTHTYEVYVYGDRKHIANNIEEDLQSYLKGEYDRHVSIDFDNYFEKQQWFDVTQPLWTKGGALW